jgi:hypothetical protein
VLVVDNGEPQNCIVFACKGRALHAHCGGAAGLLRSLAPAAAAQLNAAFARIQSALRNSTRGRD